MQPGAVLWVYEEHGFWHWRCHLRGWGYVEKAWGYGTEARARAAGRRFEAKFLTLVEVVWRD